jgi:hypothetical protein
MVSAELAEVQESHLVARWLCVSWLAQDRCNAYQVRGRARLARETSAVMRNTGGGYREALDPGTIVRRRSKRADPVAAAGLYEDLRPVRFRLESTRAGQAVVAQQIGQQVPG